MIKYLPQLHKSECDITFGHTVTRIIDASCALELMTLFQKTQMVHRCKQKNYAQNPLQREWGNFPFKN